MFKDMNIKKVSLWLFVITVVCFVIAVTIFFQSGGFDTTIQQTIDDSKNLSVDGINEIQINTVSSDINILPVDTNEVTAHFYGSPTSSNTNKYPKLTAKIENNKIIIKVEQQVFFIFKFGGFHHELKLDVSIPKSYSQDLNINTTSGNAKIDSFNFNYFKYNSVSGDLVLNKLAAKSSKFSTVSGDFSITEITGDLNFSSVSGDLNATFPSFSNSIKVGTTSGDTKINLPENAEFNLNFNTVSGDADCEFPLTTEGNHSRKGLRGSIGSVSNEITVSSVSGDLEITK
jgi:lia operon protein LiaG